MVSDTLKAGADRAVVEPVADADHQPTEQIGLHARVKERLQAEGVAERLGDGVALVWVKSEGDQDVKRPLVEIGGAGLFTAALHRALRDDRCDVAAALERCGRDSRPGWREDNENAVLGCHENVAISG